MIFPRAEWPVIIVIGIVILVMKRPRWVVDVRGGASSESGHRFDTARKRGGY